MNSNFNIVCIGGGNGTPRVLRALKSHNVHLTAVITMADSGGSAGFLRKHYGTLPTGDVRRALVALATVESPLKDMMTYRFKGGPLDEQSAGSIFLTTLENVTGSFEKAIATASELLKIKGDVLPVTLDNVQLCAELEDGTIVRGETNIDIPKHDPNLKIKKVWLELYPPVQGRAEAKINPRVTDAIAKADMIIIGPGDLYSSLIPNLLVAGVPEAIKKSNAKKVFIVNLKTKQGETQHFKAEDFVSEIKKYIPVDISVFNSNLRSPSFLHMPETGAHIVCADVLDDTVDQHDAGEKLANVLLTL